MRMIYITHTFGGEQENVGKVEKIIKVVKEATP